MKIRRKDLNVSVTWFGHVVWSPLPDPREWKSHRHLPAFISTSYGDRVIRIEGWGRGGINHTTHITPPTEAQWEELDLTDPAMGLSLEEQGMVIDAIAKIKGE